MQRDNDHDDTPPDLEDFIARLKDRAREPGEEEDSGPVWPPTPLPRSRLWRRVAQALAGIALTTLATFGIRLVTVDPQPLTTLYAQREVSVHSGEGRSFPNVRQLHAGERVLANEPGGTGWSKVFEADGHLIGYAYRSDENFGPAPPPGIARTDTTRRPTALCKDGTYWYGATRSGSCSHHKGVKEWLTPAPPPSTGARS